MRKNASIYWSSKRCHNQSEMRTIDEKLHVSWSARLLGHVLAYVYFSSRPFGVKRFQTVHRYSVDVVRGLAPLFGIGTEALPA